MLGDVIINVYACFVSYKRTSKTHKYPYSKIEMRHAPIEYSYTLYIILMDGIGMFTSWLIDSCGGVVIIRIMTIIINITTIQVKSEHWSSFYTSGQNWS